MDESTAQYKALYPYTPSDEEQSNSFMVLNKNDVLEVKRPVEVDEGSEEKPEGWLWGTNATTGSQGYFPGPYVQFQTVVKGPKRPQPKPRSRTGSRADIGASSLRENINDSGYIGSPHGEWVYMLFEDGHDTNV